MLNRSLAHDYQDAQAEGWKPHGTARRTRSGQRRLTGGPETNGITAELRAAVRFIAIANLAYFGIKFAVALAIGSVSLFADSIDFLEDTPIILLILLAFRWSAAARARTGKFLALVILVPGIAAV